MARPAIARRIIQGYVPLLAWGGLVPASERAKFRPDVVDVAIAHLLARGHLTAEAIARQLGHRPPVSEIRLRLLNPIRRAWYAYLLPHLLRDEIGFLCAELMRQGRKGAIPAIRALLDFLIQLRDDVRQRKEDEILARLQDLIDEEESQSLPQRAPEPPPALGAGEAPEGPGPSGP